MTMAERPDPDWLALADFLDAHANDMRAWTEDEPKFRAAAEGLRQLAAITAERDAAVARAAQLGTGIDSVRSHWHADEGPRWTANVIEALRHSGLMDDVMLSGTPDPDTDPNTLAEYFVEWADSVDPLWQGGFCSDNDALRERAMNARAAAEGLRQLAAITAERDQLRAERTQLTGDSMTDLKMTYAYEAGHEDGKAEVREQLDAITAAIGDLHRPMWDDPTAPGFYQTEPHREGDPAIGCCTCGTDGWPCPTAASLSPTPTPEHCPTCGSTNRDRVKPNDCEIIPDPWHDSGQP